MFTRTFLVMASVLLVGGFASGCKHDVELYCDDDNPCLPRYPDRPFCDLTGAHEDGIGNTCVANPVDAGVPDATDGPDGGTGPDAVPAECVASTVSCASDLLTVCGDDGLVEKETACPLGCFSDGTRCTDVEPSNGLGTYLSLTDKEPDVVLPDGSTINTDTGVVTTPAGTLNVANALVPAPDGGVQVRVFMVGSLRIGNVDVVGTPALAIVSDRDVTIDGELDVGGSRNLNGPGAYDTGDCVGAEAWWAVTYPGGGFSPIWFTSRMAGGAGGGFGSVGAKGGTAYLATAGPAGIVSGNTLLAPLRGGCRGGGRDDDVFGGAGGGIQIVSRTAIALVTGGALNASGSGGAYQQEPYDASFECNPVIVSGGGSGGGVLLEAPTVTAVSGAAVHANGGSGACGSRHGQAGSLSTTGSSSTSCVLANWGNGGAGAAVAAEAGTGTAVGEGDGNCQTGGGGGGGVGRIRVNTGSGAFVPAGGSVISPTAGAGSVGTR